MGDHPYALFFSYKLVLETGALKFETQPKGAGVRVPVRAKKDKMTELSCVADVESDTGANIIVPNADKSHRTVSSRFSWKTGSVYAGGQKMPLTKLNGDGQIRCNEGIHTLANVCHLCVGRTLGKLVTDFTLTALNMGIARTLTTEDSHHSLVEQMLRRVHRGDR